MTADAVMTMDSNLTCAVCFKAFTTKSRLFCHKKAVHRKVDQKPRGQLRCTSCSEEFPTKSSLIKHLNDTHSIMIMTDIHKFNNCQEFQTWKETIERETMASFAQVRRNIRGDIRRTYYDCHRSGIHRRKGEKRKLKIKGSNRIGGICPAGIRMDENTLNGKVTAYFTTPHVGHESEVGRLRLDKQERQDLAEKLQQGVPKAALLSSIRENFAPTQRIGVTTRQDLLNIAKAHKIKVVDDVQYIEEANHIRQEEEALNIIADLNNVDELRHLVMRDIEIDLSTFTDKCVSVNELQELRQMLLPVKQYLDSKCSSAVEEVTLEEPNKELTEYIDLNQSGKQNLANQKPINVIVKFNKDNVSVQALLISREMELQ